MKRTILVVWFLSISVLALLIVDKFSESEPPPTQKGSTYPSEAMEGTAENPRARAEYDWVRLRDPATNRIPRDIAHKELEFVHRMARQADLQAITSADDWVSRGPNNLGGRTKALAIDITNENNILAGSTSSGMFKSTDGGNSWVKTTAPNQLHSVTCIAQNRAAGNEQIWYYGTGDSDPQSIFNSGTGQPGTNSFYRGDGIFKSTDGGDTWTQLPSTVSGTPDQTDPFDFVWSIGTFGEDGVVAATGWGIYRSTDGGQSWERTLGSDGGQLSSPNTEVAVGPNGMIYATVAGDGPDHGVYRSKDAATWEDITNDWPESTLRTVIAPSPSDSGVVYFFTEVTPQQQILSKFESGTDWTNLTSGLPFNAQMATFGGTLLVLRVKPDDENTLFLGAIDLFRSTDGGASFELISGHGENFHPDQTSIAFYPSNPKRMIVGNDGGLYRTEDNTAATTGENLAWTSLDNGYLTTQYYTVAIDHGTPGSESIVGGTQDNGVTYTSSPNPTTPWQIIFGGDGATVAITDGGQYVYHANAATFKIFRNAPPFGAQQRTEVTPTGVPLGLWLTIFKLDAFDQKIMYLASQQALWRNSDLTAIPHQDAGGTTDVNWDSFENVTTHYIHSLGMSGAEPRRLYYSAADVSADAEEKVFYLDNPQSGQPTPVDITGENFPDFPYTPHINCIAVDPRDANKVMVVFSSYGVLSIFASDDGGGSWTPVSGNLEENPDGTGSGPSVRWLSILYVQDQPVYLAGTSVGLFSSAKLDGMNTKWSPEAATSIGNVVVDMIDVRQSDGFVAVATHGNGVYSTYITTVPTAVEEQVEQPEAFEIVSTYPNPFATSTTVAYELPRAGVVSAGVFDIRGRKVATLFEGMQQAGRQELRWNPGSAADGVYFVTVDFGGSTQVKKIVLER